MSCSVKREAYLGERSRGGGIRLRRDKSGSFGPSTSLRVEQGSSFGLELGLIGFVFSGGAERNIRISSYRTGCYGSFDFLEIGFVLHNHAVDLW